MSTTVKYGDTHAVTWRINANLAGATVAGFARLKNDSGAWTSLTVSVTSSSSTASTVSHTLTGTLPVGVYDLVIKATAAGAVQSTPTAGYHRLTVTANAA